MKTDILVMKKNITEQLEKNKIKSNRNMVKGMLYAISGLAVATYSSEIRDVILAYSENLYNMITTKYIDMGGIFMMLKGGVHNMFYNGSRVDKQSMILERDYYRALENICVNPKET